MKKIKVGIVGVSGYTGADLLRILINHPYFEITYLANSSGNSNLSDIHLEFKNVLEMPIEAADSEIAVQKCELVFLALPHQKSFEFVRELFSKSSSIKVVDLSADYRLSAQNYEKFYCAHLDLENLKHAVYGLTEWNLQAIKSARLVANPGCYPTASLLAILPFAKNICANVFIDAKSGVSGAGKKLTDSTHYPKINENIFSYSPLKHRHQIEIQQHLQGFGAVRVCENLDSANSDNSDSESLQINFVPHLSPLTRGMLVSVFATLKKEFCDIQPLQILKNAYENAPFVRLRQAPVDVISVRGSNFCDIFAMKSGNALFVNAAIDNLMRGASSQAVVNANVMCGFEASVGIPKVGF